MYEYCSPLYHIKWYYVFQWSIFWPISMLLEVLTWSWNSFAQYRYTWSVISSLNELVKSKEILYVTDMVDNTESLSYDIYAFFSIASRWDKDINLMACAIVNWSLWQYITT